MRIAYSQLALSMILVGLTVPASKVLVEWMPPLVVAELRFLLIAGLMAPMALRQGRAALPRSAGDWVSLSLLAFFGMVLFNIFLLYGLKETSAVAAGIITSTIPAATALCAMLILRERVSLSGGLAIGLAVLGILALNLAGAHDGAGRGDSVAGNLLVFGAVVSEGLYGVFARRLGGRVPPFMLTFLANLLSAAMMAPPALMTRGAFAPETIPAWVWGVFLASSLAGSLMAVLLWMRGIVHVPANRAGLFTGLIPVAGVLAAVSMLGESFTLAHAAGLGCVFVGIAVGTGFGRRAAAA